MLSDNEKAKKMYLNIKLFGVFHEYFADFSKMVIVFSSREYPQKSIKQHI